MSDAWISYAATIASAAAGSVAAAVRTSAKRAAVEGVAGALGAAPATRAKDSNRCTCGSGEPSSSERLASTNSRARPSGSADAIADSVTGSSRSMCRYCSAYAASSPLVRVPASQRR